MWFSKHPGRSGGTLIIIDVQYRRELPRLAVGVLGDDDLRWVGHHPRRALHARNIRPCSSPSKGIALTYPSALSSWLIVVVIQPGRAPP